MLNLALAVPVIAGLATGVLFLALISSIFNSTNPIAEHHYDVSLVGLKDSYFAHENVDFSIRVKGHGTNCGAPDLKIIDMNNPSNIINPATLIIDYFSCDHVVSDFDRTWQLQDIGVIQDIKLEAGHYKVVARYGQTIEKEFDVISNDAGNGNEISTPVKCQQLKLCTYQLKDGNSTYPINFRFNGTIGRMIVDGPTETLTIFLRPEGSTYLQIAIPREVVDSRLGVDGKTGADTEFVVFLDEQNVDANELPKEAREWTKVLGISDNPEQYRMLNIAIPEGTDTVEIVGTWLI